MATTQENLLGSYLKDRRTRLDPAAFGLSMTRRRTPGLRREEVAQRANVSATWYTWLEQGRGGAPSAKVLEQLARALMLTDAEREHLYLIGLGRPPDVHYQGPGGVTPRLQKLLDALPLSPAYIKTSTWDIVAWNHASTVLSDYGAMPPEQRNILRNIFCNPKVRAHMADWEKDTRFIVAAFRAETTRAGASERVQTLVDDLRRLSPEFDALWRENDVRTSYGETAKRIRHPVAGLIELEYSAFAVEGRPDLSMVIYNPATAKDAEKIRGLLKAKKSRG